MESTIKGQAGIALPWIYTTVIHPALNSSWEGVWAAILTRVDKTLTVPLSTDDTSRPGLVLYLESIRNWVNGVTKVLVVVLAAVVVLVAAVVVVVTVGRFFGLETSREWMTSRKAIK